jgi:hypothetical protein
MMSGAASSEGIRTFIIGSPGSESYDIGNPNTPGFGDDNRPWMSEAAFLSGTAWAGCNLNGPEYCHFDMTEAPDFSLALAQGLGSILGQLKPCSYAFPEPPNGRTIDEEEINVVLESGGDNTLVIRDDVGDCTEGWQLTSDNEILLCPATCSDVQLDPSLDVQITFGCASLGPTIN